MIIKGGETVIKMTKIQSAVLSAIVLTIVNILWSIAADVVKPHIMPYIVKETQSHGKAAIEVGTPVLNYEVINSAIYNNHEKIRNSPVVGIFNVKISNNGNAAAKNLTTVIRIHLGEFLEPVLEINPAISNTVAVKKETININLPLLNPGESFTVNFLVNGFLSLRDKPEIHLRADGVIGKEHSKNLEALNTLPDTFNRWNYMSLVISLAIISVGILLCLRLFAIYKQQHLKQLTVETVTEEHIEESQVVETKDPHKS